MSMQYYFMPDISDKSALNYSDLRNLPYSVFSVKVDNYLSNWGKKCLI
jgi:hypothetical protein